MDKRGKMKLFDKNKAKLFFDAKTIAVIGASREETKVGHAIFKNLHSSKHLRVFPVNPNAAQILGERCFKDILEIPYEIDLAIIVVKSEFVPEIMIQIAKKHVKAVIIMSAGFSEAGDNKLEKETVEIAVRNNMVILGPNCFGFLSPPKEINTTFFQGSPEKGKIAFISQSGAIGVAVLDKAIKENLGLSGFVSLGNSAMLDFSDFIDYFAGDEKTKIITLYMESLKQARGKKFIEACKKCKKPILVLKSGKSRQGEKAAKSHTAALASEQGVYESIFKQAGIKEVESISELFYAAETYTQYGKLGKKACIVTNAGGLGVLATDACEKNGINIVKLPDETHEKLNKILPMGWSKNNPIDIIGDALADRYEKTLKLLEKENWFDFFIVILTPQYMTQAIETANILSGLKKPVIACFMGGKKVDSAKIILKQNKIPVFDDASQLEFLGKIV